MARHLFPDFPAEEQQQFSAICHQVGLAPQEFDVTDANGDAARQVTVRRPSTGAESVYDAAQGANWLEEFESDLECGLFGQVPA